MLSLHLVGSVSDDNLDHRHSDTARRSAVSRDRLVAIALALLAVLGAFALATTALLTAEIDADDLFDSLSPVRLPALLLIAATVCASMFLAGRSWARWILALVLVGGSAWILIFMEVSGGGLRAALAVAVVWGLSGITLVASRPAARYVEAMSNHWVTAYERLIGPLQNEDDARRWLSMLDAWDHAGVVTRGDRKRIIRALVSWWERTGALPSDVGTRIGELKPAADDYGLRSLVRRVFDRRKKPE